MPPAKRSSIIIRPFELHQIHPRTEPDLDLTRVGCLYLAAALLQSSWIYLVLANWGLTLRYLDLDWLGYVFGMIWVAMAVSVPFLAYIGARLILASRDPRTRLIQDERQRKRARWVIGLLLLGIAVDALAFPLVITQTDAETALFVSLFMGGRVMQVNLEAIFSYYD